MSSISVPPLESAKMISLQADILKSGQQMDKGSSKAQINYGMPEYKSSK